MRHLAEDEISETEAGDEQDEREDLKAQKRAESAHITSVDGVESTINLSEKPVLFFVFDAAEQERRERRRQGEALKAEIDIEKAIVKANCRNRMPVVPGRMQPARTRLPAPARWR